MKIHEYNEMMAYLTRPATPTSTLPTRQPVVQGGRIGFFKGSSLAFEYGQRIKDLWLEGKTTKVINEVLNFIDDKTTTISDLIKSMKDPNIKTPITITEKELKLRPDLSGITTGGKLPYFRDPEISERIIDAANAGEDTIKGFLRKNPDLNRTSFYAFLKRTNTEWKSKGKGRPPFKKEVTENIIKIQNVLKKNPEANFEQIKKETGLPFNEMNNTIAAFKASYKTPRPDFIPDKSIEDIVSKLRSNTPMTFEQLLDDNLIKYDIDPSKISKETRAKLLRSRKAVQEFFEGGTNFEHTLPKSLIKYIDNPDKKVELLLTGSRTSPELNQFKLRYDRKLNGAVSRYLGTSKKGGKYNLTQYNDAVDKIRKTVRELTGGYEVGYLKFNKAGEATAVVPNAKSLLEGGKNIGPETLQKLSPFENAKYHNNLVINYNKDPGAKEFNTLNKAFPNPDEIALYKDQEKAYNQINKYLKMSKKKFIEFANKNIDNPAVQAIFKSPYGKATAVTAASLLPSKLAAETGQMPQDSPGQLSEKDTGIPYEAGAATAATLGKYGPQIWRGVKTVGKTVIKPVMSPLAGAGLAINELFEDIGPIKFAEEGEKNLLGLTYDEKFLTPNKDASFSTAGLEMLFPDILKRLGSKVSTVKKFYDTALRMGVAPRLVPHLIKGMTGAGLIMIAGDVAHKVATESQPGMLIDKETGEPKAFDREKASFVMPTMIDAYEQASKYAQENKIPYEEAFKTLFGDKTFREGIDETIKKQGAFNQGGRVGFAKGPKDPSKRAFIKGVTALAAIPLVGRFFKVGKLLERGATYMGPVIEKIKGMPDWFPLAVKKLWNEGEDVTKTMATGEGQIVKRGTLESGDDIDLVYQIDTGDVRIDVTPKKGTYETSSGAYNKEYELYYQKGQADELTKGKKPPDEFSVSEVEGTVDPHALDVNWEGRITDVDDAMSDLTEIEAFAKSKSTKQIHKQKGTKKKDVAPDYELDHYYDLFD